MTNGSKNGFLTDQVFGRSDWGDQSGEQRMRIQLLVSVRNAAEARQAAAADINILDLKEPLNGPLAPVQPALWRDIASMRLPICLSAALGESTDAAEFAAELPAAFRFAKVGPSHCSSEDQLIRLWQQTIQHLPATTELVAVAYADHLAADCLSPNAILDLAVRFGLRRFLIDTFIKDGTSTSEHVGWTGLRQIQATATRQRCWWALAGATRQADVARAVAAGVAPDCYGVRGDVCERGVEISPTNQRAQRDRTGRLSPERIQSWKRTLGHTQSKPVSR